MTPEDAQRILAANDAIAEGSFLYAFHEEDRFDAALFWTLYNAMTIIGSSPPEARSRALRDQAFWVYRCILMGIIHHFDPSDSARLAQLPSGNLAAYLQRIEWVFHPILRDQPGYGWDATFGDDLNNPQQAVLDTYFRDRP